MRGGRAVYPGSFNPPTVAHLAIAEAVREATGVARVDLAVSVVALGKEDVTRPVLEDRIAVLDAVVAARPWLGLVVTEARLLVDVAAGYDLLVLGADKWGQIRDPRWYVDEASRRAALAALPPLALVPRPPDPCHPVPDGALVLDLPGHEEVSSSAARAGRHDWLAPEAAEALRRDPERYAAWGAWRDPAEG